MTEADYDALTRTVLAAVASCPDRGPVLPVSLQPECGCAELSECRAGKGRSPGRVTRVECTECVGRHLDPTRPGMPDFDGPEPGPHEKANGPKWKHVRP